MDMPAEPQTMEEWVGVMQHLAPREAFAHYPLKDPVILEVLPGRPFAFNTWWDMLRFLAALGMSLEMDRTLSGVFGFWN
jgi:hypothetical protein